MVILSIITASPIAWYIMDRWLERFAYRIDLSIWIFLLAGIIAILVCAFVNLLSSSEGSI